MWKALWVGCFALLAGCAATAPDPEQQRTDEAALFQAVEDRRAPEDYVYIYRQPDAYVAATGWADLKDEANQNVALREAERMCRDRLQEALRPHVARALDDYSQWFEWVERRPESDLVARLSEQLTHTGLKVWGRFYFAIAKYQALRCVHRTQIEIHIIGEAILRERDRGGSEIEGLVRRMERLDARLLAVSRELGVRD